MILLYTTKPDYKFIFSLENEGFTPTGGELHIFGDDHDVMEMIISLVVEI